MKTRPYVYVVGTGDIPVRGGVIGTGHLATAILTQSRSIPALDVPVVADLDIGAAKRALRRAGWASNEIAVCESRGAALAALELNKRVVLPDALLMMDLPIDIVVEATGVAAAGAAHALAAIEHGKHVAMVTKETDAAVGPILKWRADRAGLVYTAVDGDQHGLLMSLVSWARELGLELLCAGKALEFDVVYDAKRGVARCDDASLKVSKVFAPATKDVAGASRARREELGAMGGLMGYDVTEMTLAVNGTGLAPDVDSLHCPVLRIPEMPELLCPRRRGGLLKRAGVVDAVTCLRTPHEPGLAGGVFVVVGCASAYSRKILRDKGHLANSRGDAFLIMRPHHLCGVETPRSLLAAVQRGVPTGATELLPRYDVLAQAVQPLRAGEAMPTDKSTAIRALMRPARALSPRAPAPLHLASGCRLRRDVPTGEIVTVEDVEPADDSPLWKLRTEQDALFLGNHSVSTQPSRSPGSENAAGA